jgi:PAS domain S-box-containing protein
MTIPADEDALLRSTALRNMQAIRLARQRAEEELERARDALEAKSRELAQSVARLRATLESTTDGILVTDASGRIADFNENYLSLWKLPPDVLASRQYAAVLQAIAEQARDPAQFIARAEEIQASTGDSFDVLELADGRVLERYSRVQRVDGRDAGRVWSVRDITAHRRIEETLRAAAEERRRLLDLEQQARSQAELASSMKDEFLATLSHELRTPLSSIFGWVKILRAPAITPADLRRGLEVIERNTHNQIKLIEDLLDMSRITSGQLRLHVAPVRLQTVVQAALETVRPAAEAKSITLEFEPQSTAAVSGDATRLEQVVWNLLSNAIKFTSASGHVRVHLRGVGSQVELRVSDTGMGIASDFLPHVFDRFRQADGSITRHSGGLGLGLAIVRHLVELHGGSIAADSPGLGQGTTFTVVLPAQIGPGLAVDEPAAARVSDSLAGVTVVVVDDDADVRELLRCVLEERGGSVTAVATAAEAVRAVEHARPHVMVVDIGLPGVDGYELLHRVRELGEARGGNVAAIALTAFARPEDSTRALRAGFAVHHAKPFDPADVIASVARLAGVGRPSPGA